MMWVLVRTSSRVWILEAQMWRKEVGRSKDQMATDFVKKKYWKRACVDLKPDEWILAKPTARFGELLKKRYRE